MLRKIRKLDPLDVQLPTKQEGSHLARPGYRFPSSQVQALKILAARLTARHPQGRKVAPQAVISTLLSQVEELQTIEQQLKSSRTYQPSSQPKSRQTHP
jgi:hypothetical protein